MSFSTEVRNAHKKTLFRYYREREILYTEA